MSWWFFITRMGQLQPLFSEFLLRLRQYPLLLLLLSPYSCTSRLSWFSTPIHLDRFWFWFLNLSWRFSKSWRTANDVLQLFENLQKTCKKTIYRSQSTFWFWFWFFDRFFDRFFLYILGVSTWGPYFKIPTPISFNNTWEMVVEICGN